MQPAYLTCHSLGLVVGMRGEAKGSLAWMMAISRKGIHNLFGKVPLQSQGSL